jgi:hypothetical protein
LILHPAPSADGAFIKGKNPPRRIFSILLNFALDAHWVLKFRALLTAHPTPSRKREG